MSRTQLCLLLLVFGLANLHVASSSKKNVEEWGVDEVCQWAETSGFKEQVDPLRAHGVDGIVLLHIKEKDLEEELAMTSGIQRTKFLTQVAALGKGKALPDRDFWQYRALDRRRCDWGTALLNQVPRFAFFMLNTDDLGEGLQNDGLKWLFPHYAIYKHSTEVMEGLPALIAWGHLVSAILEPIIVLYSLFLWSTGKKVERMAVITSLPVATLACIIASGFFYLIYPIIPWVLCDISFYLAMAFGWANGLRDIMNLYKEDIKDGKIG